MSRPTAATASGPVIRFLGVGSAFTTSDYFHSLAVIEAPDGTRMMIDCGSDARFALAQAGINAGTIGRHVQAVYITHLHSDHVGGLEWLAFSSYFDPRAPRPKMFIASELRDRLWNNCLKGGMGAIEGRDMTLDDYFEVTAVRPGGRFIWADRLFTLQPTVHVRTPSREVISYGLFIEPLSGDGPRTYFTADTQFNPEAMNKLYRQADVIFQDCEISPYPTTVHAHYDQLKTLPAEIKAKMHLYHYQPDPAVDARDDGFAGWTGKGEAYLI